ncbi:MAG: anthranilate/aminodeoxychorismate synthase component [Gammaproteobacteria bacterium]|jgi:anthranilate synthase component 2|nr:anthranilate/aminodeoxychorismate synthase component [Gammaproteobacteria bacterium]
MLRPLQHLRISLIKRQIKAMLLMIDNYDSFTYNVVRYFKELGETVLVKRNDAATIDEIKHLAPQYIVISPGPCTPNEAGISMEVIKKFTGKIPILGVCLGHQSLAQVFGATVQRARRVMHGKTSLIYHNGKGLFQGLPNPFSATRYHSLIVNKDSLPACLTVSAWTQTEIGEIDEIMGLQHRDHALVGVQFHPESVLTTVGYDLLRRFLLLKP